MNRRHGKYGTRVYGIWYGIRARCLNSNTPAYSRYGGRGIGICDRWMEFSNFFADMGDPPEGASIDRIDNNLGYSPDNCRWASRSEQSRNKSDNRLLTVHGETAPVSVFAERHGLKISTVCARLDAGWTDVDAATTPLVTARKGIPRGQPIHMFAAGHDVVLSEPDLNVIDAQATEVRSLPAPTPSSTSQGGRESNKLPAEAGA